MRLFDSHCHLQSKRFGSNVPVIIEEAVKAGVCRYLCCATCEKDWDRVLTLSERYDSIVPALGIHPWYMEGISNNWEERLLENLRSVPSVVGECGLDFAVPGAYVELQEDVFRRQLIIAQELHRPVSIHCRKAWGRLVTIVKETGRLRGGGVIHSYSGSHELVPVLEKLGFYLSFSGSVTNPNSKKVHKAAKAVSDEYLLIETDSPDLIPYTIPNRYACAYNQPAFLPAVAESIAGLRKRRVKEIADLTFENASRLFGDIL